MEGRVPPPSASDDNFLSPAGHETYVIQIPKDQIYRVPPPENALLADRFRYPETNNNNNNTNNNNNNNNNNNISNNNNKKTALKKSCWPFLCRPCTLLCMGITVLVLTLISAMVVSWVYVFLSPKSPSFYVTGFVVVSSKANPNKSSPRSYMISLEVTNGNPRTGIYYEKGGSVTLISHKRSVGECEFPTLYQQEKDLTDIQLAIHGTTATSTSATTNGTVSSEIMALEMEIPVSMNLWFVKIWRNEILVDCIFGVEPLKKNGASSNVLSEECETKFKS